MDQSEVKQSQAGIVYLRVATHVSESPGGLSRTGCSPSAAAGSVHEELVCTSDSDPS